LTEAEARSDPRTLRRNPKIEEAPLEKELMLFDPESSRFFVLNRTMAFIWRCWEGSPTPDAIVQRLSVEFEGVEPVAAEADVREALEDMISKGLLIVDVGSKTP
jgi:hypothetical protein